MRKLKKVGFFKELPHGDENGSSLVKLINSNVFINLSGVISYLENGHFLMIAPTVLTDVLSDEPKYIGTLAIQTDGEWAWPSDLAYYVNNYGISLPQEFTQHMSDNAWNIADVDVSNLTI